MFEVIDASNIRNEHMARRKSKTMYKTS